jgi:3-oxoacyl-[acyl-carrier-protein] synthase II
MLADVVITGVGIVSPIGIGREAFWSSLVTQQTGVRPLTAFGPPADMVSFGGEVVDFDPLRFVRPRKSLKVMSREIQFGYTAADLACVDAGLTADSVAPDRMGVVLGSDLIQCPPEEFTAAYRACIEGGKFDFARWGGKGFAEIFPLLMLKYLPNMPACHVAIARDARGPNNSITLGEVSSLLAIAEAARVIERGQADVMLSGGVSSRVHPVMWIRSTLGMLSRRNEDPAGACRPFDADRDGMVQGEGAATFVLESRRHAVGRGARILAELRGMASVFESPSHRAEDGTTGIHRAIRGALRSAGMEPAEIGHVNADGLSTPDDDRREAAAIRDCLGDVPVTAPKSYFGNLGSATGAVEMAVSVLGLEAGLIPPTLNYEHADPECPVNVIAGRPLEVGRPTGLMLNRAPTGQVAGQLVFLIQRRRNAASSAGIHFERLKIERLAESILELC